METIKLRQTELLDMLIDSIDDCSKEIFKIECEETKGMITSDKNKHYEENSERFQIAMYDCMKIVACLSYDLKKELGILDNK